MTLPGPPATVERVRRRCVEEGLERALGRKVTEPQAEAAGRSGGSPLDCPGLRGTAAGQLGFGQWTGGKGDSREHQPETVRQTLNLSLG